MPSDQTYRHKKRGTLYTVIGRASMQCSDPASIEGMELVVYQGEDGKLWARRPAEFYDGRFEEAAPPASEPVPEVAGVVEELDCLHVWPQSVADHHADVLTPRQIEKLYAVGEVATRAAALLSAQAVILEEARKALKRIATEKLANRHNGTFVGPYHEHGAGEVARTALFNMEAQSHVG